jgi:SAM-dependent MidA family methyltransferase
VFADALAALVSRVDTALDRPDHLDLVDLGGGRGELLGALLPALPEKINSRVRPVVVELAPRPAGLTTDIGWTATMPRNLVGVVLATEWLDNVPLDVVEVDDAGRVRYVLVDEDGTERLGPPVEPADAAWLADWWPLDAAPAGSRAEIGAPRDAAWADAVTALRRGVAVTVDYGHLRTSRPAFGTLTGFRGGRQVSPTPDGSTDLTAHVALDSVAAAGERAGGLPSVLRGQRSTLRALGVDGRRPPLELAYRDPGAYLRALGTASVAGELTEPDGLGGHHWLIQPVRLVLPAVIPEVP